MKQKDRNEIKEEYKWDLTPIFKNEEEFLSTLKKVEENIKEIDKFKGHICDNAQSLYNYYKFVEKFDKDLHRCYFYTHLNYDSDTTNVVYQEYQGKLDNLMQKISEALSFVNPEMLKCDYETILKYIDEYPQLGEYKHILENTFRYKEHVLNENEEKLISTFRNVLTSSTETYNKITDSDMKFGNIINEEGEEVEFTESNWKLFNTSSNREVRKDAFNLLYGTYEKYKNTIASTFKTNVEFLVRDASLRGFESSLEASLFSDNVDKSVYNNLIDTVNNNMHINHKYYDLKKEILDLDELHLYDVYAKLESDFNKKYSYEEAKELVFKALEPLGSEYASYLKKAFDERWIDVYNNKGKRSGAYSSGSYFTNPYVLLNYEGTLDDVSTLAHELGHSMHSYLSCQNNSYLNSEYQIFVAEVASTVNELLLRKHLIENSTDECEKAHILNEMMELFRTTIYRQTMFAEFERDMNAAFENGDVLTHEYLSNEYLSPNKKYFGDNVVVDDLIKYEWERVPHFYYNFYVYKYAIGLSCACFIVNNILSGKENAVSNYLKFLSSGGSDYPTEELKIAGVDVTKTDVIESALEMFDETIDEYKKLKKGV